jgi:hypothetical protein
MDVFLNHWFNDYGEARSFHEKDGGYLLPYKEQFVITEPNGIRVLGLDPDDPDWEKIGRDWVKPGDLEAWERLKIKRLIAI